MRHHQGRARRARRALRFEPLEMRALLDASGVLLPSLPDTPADQKVDADVAVANVSSGSLDFRVVSNWGSGFTADFRITNTGQQTWDGWTVAFDADFEITSIWNASIVSRDGNRYRIAPAAWNECIHGGESGSFGIVGSPTGPSGPNQPSNVVINQQIVGPPNLAPTAVDDLATTPFETALQLDLLANDFDPDGDSLSVASVQEPTNGVVLLNPNGTITYTPSGGFVGIDRFEYTINDGRGGSATGGVSVTVESGANMAPIAVADQVEVLRDASGTINVLANDSDPDGDALTLVSFTAANNGTVVASTDGVVTYTPANGFVGADSFTYVVSDGELSTVGQVQISVQDRPSQNQVVWPDRFFAPYVDATLTSGYSMVDAAVNYDVKFFTLAFVVADPSTSQPSWGGYYDVSSGYRQAEIEALRDLGGDVMLSFGGAANTELAVAITQVDELTAAYQSVIDQYDLTYVDFDIEGAWVRHRESIDRRSAAIKNLQDSAAAEGRALDVWYTLPVLPTGLTPDGLYVLESALAAGVRIDGVNVMAMDYGDSAAPNPEGQMGSYAIQAGENLKSQLETLYQDAGMQQTEEQLYSKVGVTPMIGQNDVITERFYQQDADQLLAWAEEKNIGMLSMWSATRDAAGAGLSPTHSGIPQAAGEFHQIFSPFSGDSVPTIEISDASVVEGDQGTARMQFLVTLNQPHDARVSVDYATSEGSATTEDFLATSGTLSFAAGETQKLVVVEIVGDTNQEGDEELSLSLSNAINARLRDSDGRGTILGDDLPPVVTIDDVEIVEASTEVVFTVALSRPPKTGETIVVDYTTRDGSATSEDYSPVTGRLVFSPGETQKLIRVAIIGENLPEPDESFEVALTSTSATIGDGIGVATILDDDTPRVQVGHAIQSDWGTGYTAATTIVNSSDEALADWRLEFTLAGEITSIWNAVILERNGDRYVIAPADWTRRIAIGQSVSFGYQVAGDSSLIATDFRLNGRSVETLDQ